MKIRHTLVAAAFAVMALVATPVAAMASPSLAPTTQAGGSSGPPAGEGSPAADALVSRTPIPPKTIAPRNGSTSLDTNLCYWSETRNVGRTGSLCSPAKAGFTGTTGQNKPLESASFYFDQSTAMTLWVRVHFAEVGWTNWRPITSTYVMQYGDIGVGGPAIEAIDFSSTNGSLTGAGHVQNVGWVGTGTSSNITIGTTGQARWLEAFWVTPSF
ncbi:hypothetical protein [Embleya sp. AB8]|uniref:hypothetical protein n=1 Tax=Embleya sp. AB8 TaxID=3156304 RepID=UPI003C72C5C0